MTALLAGAIVVGSRKLQNFDAALVVYTFAVIFATWGVAYHYAVWLQKPPTRVYWRAGWQLFGEGGLLRGFVWLAGTAWRDLVEQRFIRHRSLLRWWMHQFLFWGCLLAVAITFPLVFGWIHFGTAPDDPMQYVTYVFGFSTGSFRVRTALSWLIFHGLDVAAVLVLTGIALSLWRRMRDRGALAVQTFSMDFFPLIVLFAISVTGLALTVSVTWLRGTMFPFLALLHAITVVAGLLYLPFGKFFHISCGRPRSASGSITSGARRRKARTAHDVASGSRPGGTSRLRAILPGSASTTAFRARPSTGRPCAPPASAARSPTHRCESRTRRVGAMKDQGNAWLESQVPSTPSSTPYGPHAKSGCPGMARRVHAPGRRAGQDALLLLRPAMRIQLKVRDNQVIGFEPWEEFPFNKGMLCPKGVKRYMQNGHPDRLLAPLLRTESGFRKATWDEALDLTARRLREIQEKHGKDAVAIYGGASLTTEKSYLLGKFARVALGTRHIDYNGRLCMVSAGTAYKLAYGVDRSPNPWADIPLAQVVMVTGSNVAECSPSRPATSGRCARMVGRPHRRRSADDADHAWPNLLPSRAPGTDLALHHAQLLHVILRDHLECQ